MNIEFWVLHLQDFCIFKSFSKFLSFTLINPLSTGLCTNYSERALHGWIFLWRQSQYFYTLSNTRVPQEWPLSHRTLLSTGNPSSSWVPSRDLPQQHWCSLWSWLSWLHPWFLLQRIQQLICNWAVCAWVFLSTRLQSKCVQAPWILVP